MEHIFISYRREDSADVAGRIYDRLKDHFGDEVIFKDVDKIPFGVDFRRHLDGKVSECRAFLVIIGRNWLEAANEKGQPRLADPADFVRVEVESALRRDIPVIPLLVDGTVMPSTDELPETMRDLSYRNAVPVRPDPDFHNDMNRLINGLEHQLGIARAKAVPGTRGSDEARAELPDRAVGPGAAAPSPLVERPRTPTRARGRMLAAIAASILLVASGAYFAVDRFYTHEQRSAGSVQSTAAAQASADAARRGVTTSDVQSKEREDIVTQDEQRRAKEVAIAAQYRRSEEARRIEAERQQRELEAQRAQELKAEEERLRGELEARRAEAFKADEERIRGELEARRAEAFKAEEERIRREVEARRAEQLKAEEERQRGELAARRAEQLKAEEERQRGELAARRAEQLKVEEERQRGELAARRAEQLKAEERARLDAATAERELLALATTEQARLRREEEARKEAERRMAAQSVRLGLYPYETIRECYHSIRDHITQAASDLAAKRANVELAYSWYRPGLAPPGLGAGTKIWIGTTVEKNPNVSEIQAVSRSLGVNAVLMGWYECSASPRVDDYHYQVKLFLVDVLSGKIYSEHIGLYNTAEAVRRLMDQLVRNRG